MTKWTTEQQQIFETKGNVLVSASAGSGKTTIMVKCISDLLLNDISIENVLVLSYTIASAADMRTKIVARLFNYAREGVDENNNPVDIEKIRNQIDNITFADICTVDSFCSHIIRENFEFLGIDPSFKQMDEEESNFVRNKIIKEVIFDEHKKNDEQYFRLLQRLSSVIDDKLLTELILKLYDSIYINPYPQKFIDKIRKSVGFEDFDYQKIILDYYKSLAYDYENSINKVIVGLDFSGSAEYKILVKTMLQNLSMIKTAQCVNDLKKLFKKAKLSGGKRNHTIDIDTRELLKEINKSINYNIVDDINKRFSAPEESYDIKEVSGIIDKLLCLVESFKIKFDTYKASENKRDFLDLNRYAIKLLNDKVMAKNISDKFDYIFVDEYQDINPLQEFILQKISRGDNVFMVGDSKQSIYAFRNADTKIFLDKIALYNNKTYKGTNRKLTQNFRSQLKILEFVDRLFSAIMTNNSCGLDYISQSTFINKDTDLTSKNLATVGSNVDIKLFVIENEKKESQINGVYSVKHHREEFNSETAVAYYEGIGIAGKINEIVNAPDGKYNYSDIALLFRKRSKSAENILRALRDKGIPYISDGFEGEQGIEIKKTIINLVRVIDNSHIDIPLAGYLLSYFGGLNENELIQIRQSATKGDMLYRALEKAAADKGDLAVKCKKALNQIKRWRAMASYKNVSELLNCIIAESGYDAYILSQPMGKVEYAYFNNFINTFNADAKKSLHSFLNFYDNVVKRKQNIKLDFGNAVKVITIHGSKGLEFPVVFLCQVNEENKNNFNAKDIIVDRDLGIGTMIFDVSERAKYKSYGFSAIEIMNKRRNMAENIRLFYVAVTRAKDKLFISGTASEKIINNKIAFPKPLILSKSFLDFLFYGALSDVNLMQMLKTPEICSVIVSPNATDLPVIFNKAEKIYQDKINKIINYKYNYIEATKISPKFSVTELNRIGEETIKYMPALINSGDGRKRGIAYHTIMENIDFKLSVITEVENAIKDMVDSGLLSDEEAKLVNSEEILDCLNNDIIKNSLKGRYYREKSFMLNMPANEIMDTAVTDKVLIQGTIDLLIIGKKNIVIDFKSSVKKGDILHKKYEKQLNIYVLAAETVFGIKIDKKYIYSFQDRQFIDL